MSGSKQNSRALKFYSDVLGLEHLHYGIWETGDELTLANLKAAQERYQQSIIDLLPPVDSKKPTRVLDVGCGTGELSKALKAKSVARHQPCRQLCTKKSASHFTNACSRISPLKKPMMW